MKVCHNCGKEREQIARHWSMSSKCSPPELLEHQKEVLDGLMLGDGSVVRPSKNPRVQVNSRKKEFLEFLHRIFGVFSAGSPKLESTAEELAKKDRESGFNPDAKAQNYSDKYVWRSICCSSFEEWRSWYDGGEKEYPQDLELTSISLSIWYASDAHFDNENRKGRAWIDTANEKDSKEKIISYFESLPIKTPKWKSFDEYSTIKFNSEETKELIEFMEHPVPGYKHKWEYKE
jgi:hypothetical protein